ncbi:RDD family protein [Aeromicrobium phragmitis]|uniref:RDD family protein n=1 Tax=Aeromicrobium phragmitis TaxID=2478914 RepID=A0A3L8PL49_9ACTN|nr:RDD family protein [Aeromicrobium phragmitis]RLV55970.1 RDD family protein [Aeromicrobium phragmitis]
MPSSPSHDAPDAVDPTEATIGLRLVALVIDWLIAALVAGLAFGIGYPPEGSRQGFVIQFVFIVYVGLFVGLFGVSPGKRIVRLAVINPEGAPIGWWRGLLRTALMSIVVPALIQTKDGRGLHDLAVGSKVVKVPKTA